MELQKCTNQQPVLSRSHKDSTRKRQDMCKQDTTDNNFFYSPNFDKSTTEQNGPVTTENDLQRQSSIMSFQNLSIDGSMSVCDSQYSHYNPSINEPFVSDDADPEEKAMHAFLDACGIFQVNFKAQLAVEQKATCSASNSLMLSHRRVKPSPSFLERRRQRLLSNNNQAISATSSTGAKSQNNKTSQQISTLSGANFSADMFRPTLTNNSLPKSVSEEPNSG